MIFSKLDNNENQAVYPQAVQTALSWLRGADLMNMEPGRYDIDGDKMFANLMLMTTHPYEGSHPELHKKYTDLMYWPEGGEKIGVAPYLGTEEIIEERPENDISFIKEPVNESILVATQGCFGVFFPWDAHRPGVFLNDGPATSRKVVIKISMELF